MGNASSRTWLHQIVVNLARNKHRWWKRRGRQSSVSLDSPVEMGDGEAPMQIAASGDAPDVETVKAEFVELLSRRMEELPRKLREVLVLRNVENLSYEANRRRAGLFHRHGQIPDRAGAGSVAGKHAG